MTDDPPRDRLIAITLDESGLPPPSPEVEQERRVAIFDLIEANRFALPGRDGRPAPPGPYRLNLAIRERRLVFDVATEAGEKVGEVHLSLTPFNQVVKDYFQICEAYFDAVKRLPGGADRGDRHGPARHPRRGQPRAARPPGGQGRDRPRHRPAAVHADLRPALPGLTGR